MPSKCKLVKLITSRILDFKYSKMERNNGFTHNH